MNFRFMKTEQQGHSVCIFIEKYWKYSLKELEGLYLLLIVNNYNIVICLVVELSYFHRNLILYFETILANHHHLVSWLINLIIVSKNRFSVVVSTQGFHFSFSSYAIVHKLPKEMNEMARKSDLMVKYLDQASVLQDYHVLYCGMALCDC